MEEVPSSYESLELSDLRRPHHHLPLSITSEGHPFLSTDLAKKYDELTLRTVASGRSVNLPAEYNQYLLAFLEYQGWLSLTTLKPYVFPMIVRLFYANLAYRSLPNGETIPCSWVKGTAIDISEEKIAAILDLPSTGERIYFTDPNKIVQYAGMSLDQYYATFTTSNVQAGQLSSQDIQPRYRLLKHYLACNILPRTGHGNEVETFLGFMIHCMVTGRKLCLPYIIQRVMMTSMDYGKIPKSLPYGAILTQILLSFGVSCDVQVDISERTKNAITKNSADRISGFPPTDVASSSVPNPSSTRRASTSDVPRPHIPSSGVNPSDAAGQDFASFRRDVTTRMDAMDTKMDLMHTSINELKESVREGRNEAASRSKDMEKSLISRITRLFRRPSSSRHARSSSSSGSTVPGSAGGAYRSRG